MLKRGCSQGFASEGSGVVRDVRIIQSRRGLRFRRKAPHALLIGSKFERKNLDRDFAIQLRIFRPIHLAHSALANLRTDFIAAESCACGQTHSCTIAVGSTNSWCESYSVKQVLKTAAGAKAVKAWSNTYVSHASIAFVIRLIEPV